VSAVSVAVVPAVRAATDSESIAVPWFGRGPAAAVSVAVAAGPDTAGAARYRARVGRPVPPPRRNARPQAPEGGNRD